MSEQNQWWGYVHTNGSLQAKRWWGDERDIQDANESPFVARVVRPFPCDSGTQALEEIKLRLA